MRESSSTRCGLDPAGTKRIVMVDNELTTGGAEKQLVMLAKLLKRRGDDVTVLSIMPPRAFADELRMAGVPVMTLTVHPWARGLSALVSEVRALRRLRPDVLISFLYQANILTRLAGRAVGVPFIISSIRDESFGGRPRELLHRATERLASVTTTNSSQTARRLEQRRVVPVGRLVVVPNGVELSTGSAVPRTQLRGRLGVRDDEFLWLAVGRLRPQKDFPTLLAALARLVAGAVPVQLRVAGEGPLRRPLERLVAELGLQDAVAFLGLRADVPDLLAAADGLVLSSVHEGLPNVVMEALAAGVPVVATDVGGTAELVHPGESGFLVPPSDPAALASAMLRLVAAPPEERRRMGAEGRRLMAERYGAERALAGWLALIDGGPGRHGAGATMAPVEARRG